ncbi:MAG: hypothetical protein P9L92_14685 [Candidatus Electryonea clarkiae]|nr:hypothetical protein [Candidatus Electryonea clarkiae]MDP8288319.1 hypothetical protein [Candidatus Electryonea clarkiae]
MKKLLLLSIAALFLLSTIGCESETISRQEAYNACISIASAARQYERKTGYAPMDIGELENKGYLQLKTRIKREWKFAVNFPYDVIAKSTIKMPGGPDIEIVYEIPEPI